MEELTYIGELVWPKYLGHFLLILAFTSTFLSAFSYFRFVKTKDVSWKILGRYSFIVHGLSLFGVIGIMFYLMYTHHYEYAYVWNHISDDLPLRYLLSAFWEGQEGSFILWMFWHVVLGFVFIFKKSKWEVSVVMVLAMVEVFFATMILGIYVPFMGEELKFGSNPLALLRDTMDIPLFSNGNYLSLITGQGLNPLLQNYWMTIHPPITFLGFASVTIPFGYVLGGMIDKDLISWKEDAFKWGLFSAGILGSGIFMGALWAYEALGFGGYWAWDPVENASLVPWLFMIAGVHTHMIWRHTGRSIKNTYIFYILAFIFIIYSTYLTRSGILGDSSAHAFTSMGLENQLIIFIIFFVIMSTFYYFLRSKMIQEPKTEEKSYSREFWMVIGAIILLFAGALIIGATSLPVFNQLIISFIDPNFTGWVITDPIEHYNKYQIWVGSFIGLLAGSTMFLNYKGRNWEHNKPIFYRRFTISILLSIAIGLWIDHYFHYSSLAIKLFSISGVYVILESLDYLIFKLRTSSKLAASAFSHLGFGILIFGILFSGVNQSYISSDRFTQLGLVAEGKESENIKIFKNSPVLSKGHVFTYVGDTLVGNQRIFDINIKNVSDKLSSIEEYTLHPSAVYSNDFSKISAWNPDKKHYLDKDIFLNITGYPGHLSSVEEAQEMESSLDFVRYTLRSDKVSYYPHVDTLRSPLELRFIGLNFNPKIEDLDLEKMDLAIGVKLDVYDKDLDTIYHIEPALALKNNLIYQYPYILDPLYSRIKLDESFFNQIFSEEKKIEYESIYMKSGETKSWKDYQVTITDLVKDPKSRNYQADSLDIAVGASIQLKNDREDLSLLPIYVIRDNSRLSIKDFAAEQAISVRLANIDPRTGILEIQLAKEIRNLDEIPLNIANSVSRSDLVVIEARVFPGINLVWIGCIMMILGFFISLYRKIRKAK